MLVGIGIQLIQPQVSPNGGPAGMPLLPAGYSYVVDDGGNYVTDAQGDYLIVTT